MYSNRISTGARYNLIASDIKQAEANYNRITAQLASGKKVTSITDDPIAAVNIINTNRQLGQMETFNKNVSMGMKEIEEMDDLLDLAGGYLSTAWDKAVQANNQIYDETSLKALKTEIDEITKTMVDLANTEFNDSFVFGGANSKLVPFTIEENGDIVYHGTPSSNPEYAKKTEVADGVFETINTTGDKVFGCYRAAVEEGNGVYTAPDGRRVIEDNGIYKYENGNLYNTGRDLNNTLTPVKDKDDNITHYLSPDGKKVIKTDETDTDGNPLYKYADGGYYGDGKDNYGLGGAETGKSSGAAEVCTGVMGALKKLSNSIQKVIDGQMAKDDVKIAEGYDEMNSTLDMFKNSLTQMNTEQTKFGGVYNRLQMTESTIESNNKNLSSYLSDLQEVDIAKAASDWYNAQYAYQASLKVASSSMGMSLLNYL